MPNAGGTFGGDRRFDRTDTALAGRLNRMQDAADSSRGRAGVGMLSRQTTTGVILTSQNGRARARAVACPFGITLSATDGVPVSATVTVRPGTVNQFVASNVFDTFQISKTGTFYVKAAVVSDGQNVSSFTVSCDDSEPDAQMATQSSLPVSFDVLLAIIDKGKAYRTIACGSITLTPAEAFRTDKDSPAGPGELTYIPYYLWRVSSA